MNDNLASVLNENTRLKSIIEDKDSEIQRLRELLRDQGKSKNGDADVDSTELKIHRKPTPLSSLRPCNKLPNEKIQRYSRQLILPELGVKGQLALSKSSVLVVGAGGLGCPCAVYLASAGIGRLGIVDYDESEISNLHRQILHTESGVGSPKSLSAANACKKLNSDVQYIPYHIQLSSLNALDIIRQYDIVVDATDNVATRYLLNDACVLAKKPLVSGSALRFEGQLTVYNYDDGPCYRCLYPTPPPPETVTNCSDGGVIGAVPGVIGCLQALEVIKIAANTGTSYSQRLLLFDGLDGSFRTIKLRLKQKTCVVCGDRPSIKQLIDYEQFCGASASDKAKCVRLLHSDERITVKEFKQIRDEKRPHILIDVRYPVELDICQLDGHINIPIDKIAGEQELSNLEEQILSFGDDYVSVFVLCKQGNDSQRAVHILKDKLRATPAVFKDIRGGLLAWAESIDPAFPKY
ncbi:adenylyltransferase and sulfurtransferase MOCS3-like [Tubulanus polymorphus]|uniref:adenylyltransferase and sulfurtransferase MOCS3-like n=1 Tax=Tubulanus polymorphus TaxID=672921 RepID=UPI003DA2FB3F